MFTVFLGSVQPVTVCKMAKLRIESLFGSVLKLRSENAVLSFCQKKENKSLKQTLFVLISVFAYSIQKVGKIPLLSHKYGTYLNQKS